MSIEKFEKNITNLEKIIKTMDSESLSLDKSVKSYENGIKLAKECYEILDKAKQKVAKRKKPITCFIKLMTNSSRIRMYDLMFI